MASNPVQKGKLPESTTMFFQDKLSAHEDWKEKLAIIKILYQTRQMRECAKYCSDLLSKYQGQIHPLHETYLHFYAAISYESLGRGAYTFSRKRIPYLTKARDEAIAAATVLPDPDFDKKQNFHRASEVSNWARAHFAIAEDELAKICADRNSIGHVATTAVARSPLSPLSTNKLNQKEKEDLQLKGFPEDRPQSFDLALLPAPLNIKKTTAREPWPREPSPVPIPLYPNYPDSDDALLHTEQEQHSLESQESHGYGEVFDKVPRPKPYARRLAICHHREISLPDSMIEPLPMQETMHTSLTGRAKTPPPKPAPLPIPRPPAPAPPTAPPPSPVDSSTSNDIITSVKNTVATLEIDSPFRPIRPRPRPPHRPPRPDGPGPDNNTAFDADGPGNLISPPFPPPSPRPPQCHPRPKPKPKPSPPELTQSSTEYKLICSNLSNPVSEVKHIHPSSERYASLLRTLLPQLHTLTSSLDHAISSTSKAQITGALTPSKNLKSFWSLDTSAVQTHADAATGSSALESFEERIERLRDGGWREVGLRNMERGWKGGTFYEELCERAVAECYE